MQATVQCLHVRLGRRQSRAISRPPTQKSCRLKLTKVCQACDDAAATSQPRSVSSSTPPYSYILPRQAIALFASAAVLGPFCDGLHSQHDVLHYEQPSLLLQVDLGFLHWSFETCWWVPLLFGIAGVIIGVSVPLLDDLLARHQKQQQGLMGGSYTSSTQERDSSMIVPPLKQQCAAGLQQTPSWSAVLLCISLFVTQYGLSGILEQSALGQTAGDTPVPLLDALLAAFAMAHWYAYDRTSQGFGVAALTAVCGPLIEMGLINFLHLYHYSHPEILGVPTWIPWVYFCGGPAVGNLGRRVWQELSAGSDAR